MTKHSDDSSKSQTGNGEAVSESPLLLADGTPYEVPVEGSLGLLAMGYAGIMIWRAKKAEVAAAAAEE